MTNHLTHKRKLVGSSCSQMDEAISIPLSNDVDKGTLRKDEAEWPHR